MILATVLRTLKSGLQIPMKIQTRSMAYGRKVPYQEPNLSELPVPEGSWEANYAASNRRYTKHLVMGASFFLLTMFVTFRSGLVTLNNKPPPLGSGYGSDEDEDCDPSPKKC